MAQRVIVALAPPLYNLISWKPELPEDKLAVVNNFSMGHVIKTVVVYETAWWRDLGCSGQIWDTNGPVLYSMDDCKPAKWENGLPENPALMGFCEADDAKFWTLKTREERKQAIVQQYAKLLNCNKALCPVEYVEKDWNQEEFSGGCYVAAAEIGTFAVTSPSLRLPFDKVHLAGTELATSWVGYMDGAIQSGERAGREVLSQVYGQSFETLLAAEPRQIPAKLSHPGMLEKLLGQLFDVSIKFFGGSSEAMDGTIRGSGP
jgi:monoamine oxidase